MVNIQTDSAEDAWNAQKYVNLDHIHKKSAMHEKNVWQYHTVSHKCTIIDQITSALYAQEETVHMEKYLYAMNIYAKTEQARSTLLVSNIWLLYTRDVVS